jgi:hypothetical protein
LKRHPHVHAGFLMGAVLLLGACAQQQPPEATAAGDDGVNAYPTTYKTDILAAMHAYLNDPTGVRDGAIAQPALKSPGMTAPAHYVVCLRFNAKSGSTYAGMKDIAAVFIAGRFDHFVERPKELCADAAYGPFPELEKLTP